MTKDELMAWGKANQYLAANQDASGNLVALLDTVTGAGQIIRGDTQFVNDRWTYVDLMTAIEALIEWTDRGFHVEPEGWIRHQPSNRRRPDGDASREVHRA